MKNCYLYNITVRLDVYKVYKSYHKIRGFQDMHNLSYIPGTQAIEISHEKY